jgi:hypothetical protein
MMPLLLLLACPPSSDDSPVVAADPSPFCTWTEDVPCTDANVPQPLDGDLLLLHICLDYDSGLTACSGGSWRMFDDGTWAPSQCGEGFYYRACIALD